MVLLNEIIDEHQFSLVIFQHENTDAHISYSFFGQDNK